VSRRTSTPGGKKHISGRTSFAEEIEYIRAEPRTRWPPCDVGPLVLFSTETGDHGCSSADSLADAWRVMAIEDIHFGERTPLRHPAG